MRAWRSLMFERKTRRILLVEIPTAPEVQPSYRAEEEVSYILFTIVLKYSQIPLLFARPPLTH